MREVWRMRKVREEVRPAGWFLANERNWRTHPTSQAKAILGSLNDLGWIDNVKVNLRTDETWGMLRGIPVLLDGHARIVEALKQGDDTAVPVEYYDLTPNEETEALLVIDPSAALAGADSVKLDELIRQLATDDEGIIALIDGIAADAGVPGLTIPEGLDGDELPFGDDGVIGTPSDDRFVNFSFGDYRGRVSKELYLSFDHAYIIMQRENDAVTLDDVLSRWLDVRPRQSPGSDDAEAEYTEVGGEPEGDY